MELDTGTPLTVAALGRGERAHVECLSCTPTTCTVLQSWLYSAGSDLQSIKLAAHPDSRMLDADAWINKPNSNWHMPELQLPCQQLSGVTRLSLKLLRGPLIPDAFSFSDAHLTSVQEGSNSNENTTSVNDLAALSALKQLSVTDCLLPLNGLGALATLERLELNLGWCVLTTNHLGLPIPTPPPGTISKHSAAAALQRLTNLTHLSLAGSCCCPEVFTNIQHLRHLQELVLGWAEIPQPLIKGSEAWAVNMTLDNSSLPSMQHLVQLTKLVVAGAVEYFHLELLKTLPVSLQHLQLDDCKLVMAQGSRGLALLAGFRELRHLSISSTNGPLSQLAVGDCAALTASSKLTSLCLSGCQVPAGGCSQMFPTEWQLPSLMKLEVTPSLLDDPSAIMLISKCCPNLQDLVVGQLMTASHKSTRLLDLVGLQEVSQLKKLVLTGVTLAGSQGFRVLGELTGLQELIVSTVKGFRLADVVQLTAMKHLRCLKLLHMQLTEVLAASLQLTHQGPDDTEPNVCKQIPPALLKQAIWLYPLRALPTNEDLLQLAELVDMLQAHFTTVSIDSGPVTRLHQHIIALALALLKEQKVRVEVAALAGMARNHPVLQGLQQKTHNMRQTLLQLILEVQERINDPQALLLQPGSPCTPIAQPASGCADLVQPALAKSTLPKGEQQHSPQLLGGNISSSWLESHLQHEKLLHLQQAVTPTTAEWQGVAHAQHAHLLDRHGPCMLANGWHSVTRAMDSGTLLDMSMHSPSQHVVPGTPVQQPPSTWHGGAISTSAAGMPITTEGIFYTTPYSNLQPNGQLLLQSYPQQLQAYGPAVSTVGFPNLLCPQQMHTTNQRAMSCNLLPASPGMTSQLCATGSMFVEPSFPSSPTQPGTLHYGLLGSIDQQHHKAAALFVGSDVVNHEATAAQLPPHFSAAPGCFTRPAAAPDPPIMPMTAFAGLQGSIESLVL